MPTIFLMVVAPPAAIIVFSVYSRASRIRHAGERKNYYIRMCMFLGAAIAVGIAMIAFVSLSGWGTLQIWLTGIWIATVSACSIVGVAEVVLVRKALGYPQ